MLLKSSIVADILKNVKTANCDNKPQTTNHSDAANTLNNKYRHVLLSVMIAIVMDVSLRK